MQKDRNDHRYERDVPRIEYRAGWLVALAISIGIWIGGLWLAVTIYDIIVNGEF